MSVLSDPTCQPYRNRQPSSCEQQDECNAFRLMQSAAHFIRPKVEEEKDVGKQYNNNNNNNRLLNVHPGARISSQRELQQTKLLRGTKFERILAKQTNPLFKPSKDHLNCDPSLELEEMIIETKPLHKKKKRLAKQRSIHRDSQNANQGQLSPLDSQLLKEFLVYNRFKEQKRKAMEKKETEWQQELDQAMASSEADATTTVGRSESVPARLATISEAQPDNGSTNNGTTRSINSSGTKPVSKQADSLDYIDRTPSPKPSI
ncbi:serine/threonine-protein kinase 32C-like [Armigeres subalbatus]|uniref:serine/threonine-protein kinase 32C-like n=1 Tax=Armigeres subalbatus TaxID=124917 RepID=UPI002ED592CD